MKNGTLTSFYHIHDPPYPREDSPLTAVTASFPPTWIYCALEDDLIPVSQSFMMADRLRELEVEVHAEGIRAPHGYSDLPMRYFPDRAEGWWRESILPSLKWANSKLQR
jgi:acetyl esterase/lipase